MDEPKTIFFAAGASGGHIMPAVAIREALADKADCVLVGAGRPLEAKLAKSFSLKYCPVAFTPVLGKGGLGLLKALISLPGALLKSFKLFRKEKPDIVVGFGGYPSFIPALTAWISRVPFFIQEQNHSMGLANRVLSKLATRVFISDSASTNTPPKKIVTVGNPVRKKFLELESTPAKELGRVLFLGGSQGAMAVNNLALELAEWFSSNGVLVAHQTGERDFERVQSEYKTKPDRLGAFFDDVAEEISKADLIISRAGAMTVAELSAAGKAVVYIPLSIAAGHQKENVQAMVSDGAAWCFEESESLKEQVLELVETLLANPQLLQNYGDKAKQSAYQDGKSNAQFIADYLLENV